MLSVLQSFQSRLNQLIEYFTHLSDIENLLTYNSAPGDSQQIKQLIQKIRTHLTNDFKLKKTFEYNATIISLYGFFERFIEDITTSFLVKITKEVPSFNDLPDVIKTSHLPLTAELILDLTLPKYQNVNKHDIISNLHSCLNTTGPFTLNNEAFINHSSNFWPKVVQEHFKKIGISNINNRIRKNGPFKSYTSNKLGTLNIANISDDVVFELLTELIQRRNDIAHGVASGVTIQQPSVMIDYIYFLQSYSQAIYDIIFSTYLSIVYKYKCIQIKPLQTFRNGTILGAECNNITVKVGDSIIARIHPNSEKELFCIYKISSIQINGTSIQDLNITSPTNIGFSLNGRVSVRSEFYYLA